MAKGIGLIGNFRGKVGNMVGYNLKDSNNKQTQGVRVYQPVVKNPKTSGQAEQRAKLAPINATYRALKAIIDRGQEGKAYGNKSRLAWLSAALKAFDGGWFEKNQTIGELALVPLTKGSLPSFGENVIQSNAIVLSVNISSPESVSKVGQLSAAIIAGLPYIKNGDQITFLGYEKVGENIVMHIQSLLIDTESTENIPSVFSINGTGVTFGAFDSDPSAGSIILSREGDNGQHLRSSESLIFTESYDSNCLTTAAKEAAIKSYMAAGANTDWAEESLQ